MLGVQSNRPDIIASPQSTVWSAGLSWSRRWQWRSAAGSEIIFGQQEVLGTYVKVVRNGFGEVSDALVNVRQTLTTGDTFPHRWPLRLNRGPRPHAL